MIALGASKISLQIPMTEFTNPTAFKSASSAFALRKTSGWLGRSSFSGDYRLRPAPCGDSKLILVRDLRGMNRSWQSLC